MATINYTADYDVAGGAVRVEWANLSGGDQGQVFECVGLENVSGPYVGAVKPVAGGGVGGANVAILFVKA